MLTDAQLRRARCVPRPISSPAAPRIGVLTFHRCINYGSYWQARCLVEGLRRRGYDAVLLDYVSREATRAEWRCALQPLLPRRSTREDRRLYAAKVRKFLAAIEQLPLSAPFPLAAPAAMERFDLVLVGSDEVWNLSHPWYGGKPIFYGEGVNAGRLVAYAASFGNYDADAGLDRYWAGRLRDFSDMSVRDQNSREIVRRSLDAQPPLVLDPCLQFPPEVEPQETGAQPYVAVYGHSLPHWFWQKARRWAAAVGCRLVSIGYRNDGADEQRLAAGPEEFARLIANARAVVTNFFHGCIFALLNDKPFACAPSAYRFNKVRDLTRLVGAERRLASEATPFDDFRALLEEPLDSAISARIAVLRQHSRSYLEGVLA